MLEIFEWHSAKNRKNFAKHGLRFEDAPSVFSGKIVTFSDNRKDYGEERYISLGQAHTFRGNKIRIISMRKANEREKKIYQERLKESR